MGRGASTSSRAATLTHGKARRQARARRRASHSTAHAQERRYRQYAAEHIDRRLITTTEDVRRLAASIRQRNIRAVNLDFETERGLSDQWGVQHGAIRLIQIGITGERTRKRRQWLIDCHHADPSAIVDILTDPDIEKRIFYSPFEQEWAKATFGRTIQHVWDPCLAWQSIQKELGRLLDSDGPEAVDRILPGWRGKEPGTLAALTKRFLGFALPKDMQSSDWGAPELSSEQLDYAAMDVIVLDELTHHTKRLCDALRLHGRMGYRMRKVREEARDRIQQLNAGADGSRELAWALVYADTTERLDRAWAQVEVSGVMPANHSKLRGFYEQRRAELGRADTLETWHACRAAYADELRRLGRTDDEITALLERYDRLRPAPAT